MPSNYGKGALPNPFDPRDWDTHRGIAGRPPLLDAASNLPISCMLDGWTIRSQGNTSSCVGQALAGCVEVRAHAMGFPIPRVSALEIYTLARRGTGTLVDQGSVPREAMSAIRDYGICAESKVPFDEAKINDRLTFELLQTAADAKVTGYYNVAGTGSYLCTKLRQALAAGYPVAYAQEVDQTFEDYSGGTLGPYSGKSLGGHYTFLTGYGLGYFIGVNSWSPDWGRSGLYYSSDQRIGDENCTSDFYALTISPESLDS